MIAVDKNNQHPQNGPKNACFMPKRTMPAVTSWWQPVAHNTVCAVALQGVAQFALELATIQPMRP